MFEFFKKIFNSFKRVKNDSYSLPEEGDALSMERELHNQNISDRKTNRQARRWLARVYILYLFAFTGSVFYCIIKSKTLGISDDVLIKLITFGFTKATALSWISAKYYFSKS